MNSMLVILSIKSILSEVLEQCDIPSYAGLVITKYYRETCPHCQRITPLLAEIDDRLERNNISFKVRNVECAKCSNCRKDNIDAVPTIVLAKDGLELGRFRGYREFDDIIDFLHKHTGIDKKIFKTRTKSNQGKVVKLKEKDFYTGFEGPWLILFYKKINDKQRALVSEIATVYNEKLNVGEISESDAANIAFKYHVGANPLIIAFYNGLTADYTGDDELPSLIDFCDTLINPSLEELTLEKLLTLEEDIKPGEPIFIVFYSDLKVANSYFKKPAHEFKYKVKMFKTNDVGLFEKAGIYPKVKNLREEVSDGDVAILTVYRNKTFHRINVDITDTDALYNWIFHAHYPNVTRVTNENFHTIFHGYKAVVILLTRGEMLVDNFEYLSENRHMGVPFAEQIFAVIDLTAFPVFAKMLFPTNTIPSLVFYNPVDRKFYGNDKQLEEEKFIEMSINFIKDFEKGRLYQYPFKKHRVRNVFLLLTVAFIIGGFCLRKKVRAKFE